MIKQIATMKLSIIIVSALLIGFLVGRSVGAAHKSFDAGFQACQEQF